MSVADPQPSADDLTTAAVRALAAGRGLTLTDLAQAVAIPRSTFDRRLSRGGWTLAEAARIADWFGVGLDDLRSGLGGHLAP